MLLTSDTAELESRFPLGWATVLTPGPAKPRSKLESMLELPFSRDR
jgi:hypothetical protein